MERSLAAAERLAAGEPEPAVAGAPQDDQEWSPPEHPGVIPPELVDRAASLHAAQQALIGRMRLLQEEAQARLGALRSIPSTTGGKGSVYLDVAG